MSLDEIKSDQDSGTHNRPNMYFYQPTHMSGLAFYCIKKLIHGILQGLSPLPEPRRNKATLGNLQLPPGSGKHSTGTLMQIKTNLPLQ